MAMKNVPIEGTPEELQFILGGKLLALECIVTAWLVQICQIRSPHYPLAEINRIRAELVDSIGLAQRPVADDDYTEGVVRHAIDAVDHLVRNAEVRIRDNQSAAVEEPKVLPLRS